jgi:hypothetical protein
MAALLIIGCGGGEQEKTGRGGSGGRVVSRTAPAGQKTTAEFAIGENLVVNPGFEEWDGYKPAGWTLSVFSGKGNKLSFYGKGDDAYNGDGSFYMRGLYDTQRWMTATQRFPVVPGHNIKFSAAMKAVDVKQNQDQADNAGVYLIFLDENGERLDDRNWADRWTRKRYGTSDWKRIREKAEVPEGASFVEIGLINMMTGYVYFDDVELIVQDRVDWVSKDRKFITYNWLPERPFPEEDMDRVSEMIEWIAKDAGIKKIEGRINYFLYPDEAAFMRILERPKYRTAARWDKKELHDVLTFNDHEMIHLILYDLGFPPVGLSKGLVFYYRARYNEWDMHIRSKRFLMQRKIPALYKTINPDKWRTADHAVVVPAWASFVEYLIDSYGLEKLKELYAETTEMTEPGPFSARFRDVYGEDFQEMDRAWRLYIMRYQGDAAADTLPDG